jgi:hypothetical protein
VKHLLSAIALLLGATGTAQAAGDCGRASAPVGAGTLELSLWQEDGAVPSEHAILSIAARDDRFVMDLSYRPAGGQVGSPYWVDVYAYAPWQRQVRDGEVLRIGAGRARWQGPVWITGLHSRSARPGGAALFPVAGDRVPADPALIRAFAAGGKARLARETKDGSRIKSVVDLPRPRALNQAYRTARTQAAAALAPCPPPVVSPVSAP